MSMDADVRAGEGTAELPPEPRLLTWREAERERRARARDLRAVIRTFTAGK